MKAKWSVLVVYEDSTRREKAVKFSDSLVDRFWTQCEFDLSWWSCEHLRNLEVARLVAEKAMLADLIVLALKAEGPIPHELLAWIDRWIRHRVHEGTLVGLVDSPEESEAFTEKHLHLRNLAHRAGMDYLTHEPEDIGQTIPDSIDSYAERAGQKTNVLDEIMKRQLQPPGLGVKPGGPVRGRP